MSRPASAPAGAYEVRLNGVYVDLLYLGGLFPGHPDLVLDHKVSEALAIDQNDILRDLAGEVGEAGSDRNNCLSLGLVRNLFGGMMEEGPRREWCPDQELNLDPRFRKPLLYPFELSGRGKTGRADERTSRGEIQGDGLVGATDASGASRGYPTRK